MRPGPEGETRGTILLAEDEYLVAAGIMAMARKMGFSVCGLAASGEEALELLHRQRPDLILMDVVLRGRLTGIETARRMRRHCRAPIVFMSAHPSEHILEQLEVEGVMVLPKPFTAAHLQQALEQALARTLRQGG